MEIKKEKEEVFLDPTIIVKEEYSVQETPAHVSRVKIEPCPEDSQETIQFIIEEVKEKNYPCPQCPKTFRTPYQVRKHMSRHFTVKNFHCPKCPKAFPDSPRLKAHLNTHVNNRPVQCKLCGKVLKNEITMKMHLKWHTKAPKTEETPEPFTCPICFKVLKRKQDFGRHRTMHVEKSTQCAYCHKIYSTRNMLSCHVKRKHTGLPIDVKNENEPCKCKICKKFFDNIKILKMHVNIHKNNKPYICDICGKRYMDKPRIREHIRMVHKKKTHRPNPITQKSNTDPTKDEHTYECCFCAKKFKYRSLMFNHMQTHTRQKSEKPLLTCKICGITRKYQKSLEKHELTHKPKQEKTSYSRSKTKRLKQVIDNRHSDWIETAVPEPAMWSNNSRLKPKLEVLETPEVDDSILVDDDLEWPVVDPENSETDDEAEEVMY